MARQIDPLYAPEKFRHRTLMTVRFADLDALAHLNHAAYLTYMETARMAYARDVWGWEGSMATLNMIVAHAEVNYLAALHLHDQVAVFTRIARLGRKSFDMIYAVYRVNDDTSARLAATGKTAMVSFDYALGQTMEMDASRRERTLAYEVDVETV